jgi:hypothetical protein
MQKIQLFFILFFLCFLQKTIAKTSDFCTIRFEMSYSIPHVDAVGNVLPYSDYNTFKNSIFNINGQFFNPDTSKIVKIRISKTGIDSILYAQSDSIFYEEVFLTRFRKGETYTIRYNICTNTYSLYPQKGKHLGKIRFKNKSNIPIIGTYDIFGSYQVVLPQKKSKYIYPKSSMMCSGQPFAIRFFEAQNPNEYLEYDKESKAYFLKNDENIPKKGFVFHFLHEEKITLVYENGKIGLEIK